jgi:hypothetical protein
MTSRFLFAFVLAGLVLLGGCPTSSGGTDAGGSDASVSPLVGTWRRESHYGESSRTLSLTFAADGTLTGTETFSVVATSAANNGGCSSTILWQGTWSTAGTTLTISGTAGTNTTTGCNDTTLNASSRASTSDEIVRFGAASEFTVTSTTLAFESYGDPAPYTRQ